MTVLGDSTFPFSWNGAKAFLGACSLFLSLESGKDSQHKLSCCVIKTGPFLDSFTAQSKIFFCLGGAQAAPTMRQRDQRMASFLCVYLLLMAQCVLKGASACGKRWQLVFHCAETGAAHAAHVCAELPPGRRAPRAVGTSPQFESGPFPCTDTGGCARP